MGGGREWPTGYNFKSNFLQIRDGRDEEAYHTLQYNSDLKFWALEAFLLIKSMLLWCDIVVIFPVRYRFYCLFFPPYGGVGS